MSCHGSQDPPFLEKVILFVDNYYFCLFPFPFKFSALLSHSTF